MEGQVRTDYVTVLDMVVESLQTIEETQGPMISETQGRKYFKGEHMPNSSTLAGQELGIVQLNSDEVVSLR